MPWLRSRLSELRSKRWRSNFSRRGGRQIGGCYDDALVPAEFFRDDLAAFLVRENFAGTLNSASDEDRAKIKMFEKYFGCSMPYDGIGEFLQSHHIHG